MTLREWSRGARARIIVQARATFIIRFLEFSVNEGVDVGVVFVDRVPVVMSSRSIIDCREVLRVMEGVEVVGVDWGVLVDREDFRVTAFIVEVVSRFVVGVFSQNSVVIKVRREEAREKVQVVDSNVLAKSFQPPFLQRVGLRRYGGIFLFVVCGDFASIWVLYLIFRVTGCQGIMW